MRLVFKLSAALVNFKDHQAPELFCAISAWSSWAGLPHSLQVGDRGKEFMAVFADQLKTFGVEQEVMPLVAPWKGGKAEKAGHLWKELWKKVVQELSDRRP